jgi:nucleotide-binding universal stress UspA family protein
MSNHVENAPLDHVLVPVASEKDASATCAALNPYLDEIERITAVHVIEKAGGAPDKAGVEQREEYAEAALSLVEDYFAGHPVDVETEILYGTDVVETVVDHAHSFDATAIAFLPREAGVLTRLLTGQTTVSMVTDTDLPVIVLPDPDGNDDE